MKKILTLLLSCLITVGMICVPVAADYDIGDLIPGVQINRPWGITLLTPTTDITYGDPSPKPRFAVFGKEMVEGVDFDYIYYRYRGPNGPFGISHDYRYDRESGDYVVCAYFKGGKYVKELYEEMGVTDYDYYVELDSFYVAPFDLANATYDPIPEMTYDVNDEYMPVHNLNCKGYEIRESDVQILRSSGTLDRTITIAENGRCTAYKGRLVINYKLKPREIPADAEITKDEFVYTGRKIYPKDDKDFQLEVGGRTVYKNDYYADIENPYDIGTTKLIITGKDGYTGTAVFDVKIVPDDSKPTPTPRPTARPTSKPTVKPTVAPTSGPDAKPTAAVTPKVTATPAAGKPATPATPKPVITQSADPKARVMDFVKRIYTYVLDREPEAEGAAFWSDELWSFRRTGAEVGLQFIFSDEFTARGLSNEEFVNVLYKTFFGRDAEEEGFKYWTSALDNGTMDRFTVAYGFVYSQEWADTCASYGIRSGGDIASQYEIKPSAETLAFVERMYTTALGRESDKQGLEYWACELANFRCTGEQVGAAFFLSEEMNGYGLSNDEFVTRLYKTFMDRAPEEDGFKYWTETLNSGAGRDGAVLGFTRSEEFVGKCIDARILPY